MLTLSIKKLRFPGNMTLDGPIVASLYIKGFYAPDSSYSLIEGNVNINADGTINESPLPSVSIDPTQKYVLKAVNDFCMFNYTQEVVLFPHCPPEYTLASDGSVCFIDEEVSATPPSAPENTVAATRAEYSVWGSLIFNPGFNLDGTGPFTQIPYSNPFWVNGAGWPSGSGATALNGPLNRSGLWAAVTTDNQDIGYSVCVNLPNNGTYYVGVAADNYPIIRIDGDTILTMDPNTVGAYLASNGYPGVSVESTFRFWFIYPVVMTAGEHVIEIIGHNVAVAAAMGAEVYNATPADLAAAASYSDLGAKLIFSTKDAIGMPVQLGTSGIGYSCPVGFSLRYCDSPITCIRRLTTPVLF